MPKDYSKDQLIQRSAAEFLEKELGWTNVYAFDKKVLGPTSTLGHTSYHEVLLTGRFRKALKTQDTCFTDNLLARESKIFREREDLHHNGTDPTERGTFKKRWPTLD